MTWGFLPAASNCLLWSEQARGHRRVTWTNALARLSSTRRFRMSVGQFGSRKLSPVATFRISDRQLQAYHG